MAEQFGSTIKTLRVLIPSDAVTSSDLCFWLLFFVGSIPNLLNYKACVLIEMW